MTKKRIVPSVRKVAKRLAHILKQAPEALDYDGTPVVTLSVRKGYDLGRGWNYPTSWRISWERHPQNWQRNYRTAYATAGVSATDDVEALARELLFSVRCDAENRHIWDY